MGVCGYGNTHKIKGISWLDEKPPVCLIAGFCRGVNEIFALLRCYAAQIGSDEPTFWEDLSGLVFKRQTVWEEIGEPDPGGGITVSHNS
jgi:hypothetical protein